MHLFVCQEKNPILHLELCASNVAKICRKGTVTKTLSFLFFIPFKTYLFILIKMTITVTKEETLSEQLCSNMASEFVGALWQDVASG